LRSHPAFGLLLLLLYRKILDVALLRLRFCSILATKSASKSGAIPKGLFTDKPLTGFHPEFPGRRCR
jgi:hypothetical protein